jgi:two-component system, NarL family, response regulator NreC
VVQGKLVVSNSRGREVTVLVADGHEAARKFVAALLQDNGLRVVGEVADGHEAVRLCEQLRPDIVVLDTTLPELNGFEAARKIAKLSPATKIVFLTLDTIKTYAEEALRAGGVGLVFKLRVVPDLLPAIEAALEGKTYFTGQN